MGRVGAALGRGLRRRVGDLPTAFWWLWSGTLVNRFGYFVQPFLLLYLVSERGLSTPQAGLALTALGAGSLVSQPIGGVLSDRLGPARALVVALSSLPRQSSAWVRFAVFLGSSSSLG